MMALARIALLLQLCVAAYLAAAPAAHARIGIELKGEVVVTNRFYTLGDIASVAAPPDRLTRRLLQTQIGETPRPGYLAHVSKHQVAARLEQVSPGLHKRLDWKGSNFVRIRAGGVAYAPQAYAGAAQAFLEGWLSSRYENFQVQTSGRLKDVRLPAGKVTVQPKLPAPIMLNKRMCVWVDLLVDGEHYQSVPVWFAVSVLQDVLVASRELAAGSLLQPEDLSLGHRDISWVRGTPVANDLMLEGKRLKRRIPAGKILTGEALEALPAVVKGQQVMVRAVAGRVSLVTPAIALADGRARQRIWVRKPDSREKYSVVVAGDGLAIADGRRP